MRCGLSNSPAIDIEYLSGDEAGIAAEEEASEVCDIVRFAPAFEGSFVEDALLPVIAGGFAPCGADPAWCDAVDADVGCEAECEGAGETHDGIFCGGEEFAAVAFHTAVGLIPADGEDTAVAGIAEVFSGGACEFDGACDVCLEECFEFLLEGGVAEFGGEQIGAGVADECVEGCGLEGGFEQFVAFFGICDVCGDDFGVDTEIADFCGGVVGLLEGLAAVDDDISAGACAFEGHGPADSAGGAGDENSLSAE